MEIGIIEHEASAQLGRSPSFFPDKLPQKM